MFVPEPTHPPERPAPRAPDHILGLDFGQMQDYTALAVLERAWENRAGRPLAHYSVRFLRRWPLHTAYGVIVGDVCRLARTPPLTNPLIAADQTGVGVAVVDQLRQARPAARLRPILVTAGHEVTPQGFG